MENFNRMLFNQGTRFLTNPNQPFHALGWAMILVSNF